MHIPLISIIVPVYNSSKYLEECLSSIALQSFSNYELILIDDGSTDNSLDICQRYCKQNPRIKLFNKGNGGVSSARNFGIRKVNGEFITFIDSDDYINEDYLKTLVDNIDKHIDLVQSGLVFFDNSSGQVMSQEILPEHDILRRSIPTECFSLVTLPLITSPVSKLYKTSIIKGNNIFFDEGLSYGEDRDFNLRYLKNIRTVKSISYCGYFYRKKISNSLSCNKDYLKLLNIDLKYWCNLKMFFKENNCDAITTEKYLVNRLFNFYNDRFIQVTHTNIGYTKLNNIIRRYLSQPEYEWLKRNAHIIENNRLVVKIYQSSFSPLIAGYLKLMC